MINYLHMDYELSLLVGVLLLCGTWAWILAANCRRHQLKMPPGPRRWPVVGNLLQLGCSASAPHQTLARLSKNHGPVMTLHLGSMPTVVISSGAAARIMFKNHDAVLAGRKIYESMKGDVSNEGSIITNQYGPHWRMLRRMCTVEFFASGRLDAMRGVRSKCINQMVQFIKEASASDDVKKTGVDVGRNFFLMGFNLIGNLIFSKDLLGPESEMGAQFFYHARKVMEFAGKPNIADFWPVLSWLDPQSIRRKTQFHVKHAFDIAGEFLKERMGSNMENRDSVDNVEKKTKDYLDVLLEYRGDGVNGPPLFSSQMINVIVFEMFTAGTDTTTSTLEWAMAELLHSPTTLHIVQYELRTVISPGKILQEENLEQLPYLMAVIKETLRLHPPLPFLVPHKAMDSCQMMGFHIPKETQVLVNVWAIGRDPKIWKDPLEFKPERFLEPNMVDYKGQHFDFMPFGSGRRMCPAVPLADRVLPMALGSVLHSFNWVLPDGLKPKEMDMKERMGITLRKAVPLKAIPIFRIIKT